MPIQTPGQALARAFLRGSEVEGELAWQIDNLVALAEQRGCGTSLADVRRALLMLAADVRRARPVDWTPDEADERIARQLERLAEQIS